MATQVEDKSVSVQASEAPKEEPVKGKDENPTVPKSKVESTPPAQGKNMMMDVGISSPLPTYWNGTWDSFALGMGPDDEHVTVWDPTSGKTVAGNAAPYRKNLESWLKNHSGWEEKADELKSSKRRSAARRSKIATQNFMELCNFAPMAFLLATDLQVTVEHLSVATGQTIPPQGAWNISTEASIRLQEAFVEMARRVHACRNNIRLLGPERWFHFARTVDPKKDVYFILLHAYDAIVQRYNENVKPKEPEKKKPAAQVPISPVSGASSAKNRVALEIPAFLTKPFKPMREPRVTVWNPETGRTVSGNAAPCRRNLAAWMQSHPGWEPKPEETLSSSRRKKSTRKKVRFSADDHTAADALIMFNDAVMTDYERLLALKRRRDADTPSSTPGMSDTSPQTPEQKRAKENDPEETESEDEGIDEMEIEECENIEIESDENVVDAGMEENVGEDTEENMEEDTKEDTEEDMEEDTEGNMEEDMEEDIEDDIEVIIEIDTKEEVKQVIEDKITMEIRKEPATVELMQDVEEDSMEEITEEPRKKIKLESMEEIKEDIEKEAEEKIEDQDEDTGSQGDRHETTMYF